MIAFNGTTKKCKDRKQEPSPSQVKDVLLPILSSPWPPIVHCYPVSVLIPTIWPKANHQYPHPPPNKPPLKSSLSLSFFV